MAIRYYYDASKNEDGAFYPGVPLGDVTDEVYEAQPEWIRKAIDAAPMYRKTRPEQDAPKAEKPQEAPAPAKGGKD